MSQKYSHIIFAVGATIIMLFLLVLMIKSTEPTCSKWQEDPKSMTCTGGFGVYECKPRLVCAKDEN